ACGYGWTTAIVLIPVLVQDLAAQAGVQSSNHALPCDPDKRDQCVAWFFGAWLEPGIIALYVSSISSIVAFFVSLSVAAIADYGNYRKPLLFIFSLLGFGIAMSFLAITEPSQFWVTAVLAPLGWSAYMVVTIIGTSYLCLYGRAHPQVQATIREIEASERQREETVGTAAIVAAVGTPAVVAHGSASAFATGSAMSMAALSPSRGSVVVAEQAPWTLETQARVRKEEEQATNDLSGWCALWANIGSCCAIVMCLAVSVAYRGSIFSLQLATALTGVWWILWTLACWRWLEPRPGPPLPKGEFWLLISWKKNWHALKAARKLSQLSIFLMAWFMLSDAGNTITSVLYVIAYEDLHFTHIQSMILQLLMSVMAGVGAWLFLYIRQRWRLSTKTMIFITLIMYVMITLYIVIPDLFTTTFGLRHDAEAWVAVCYVGLIISTFFGCLRVMMAELCPLGDENEYLGLFLLCDKGSSWIGPLVTGAIATRAGGEYRKGFWFPLGLLVVGAVLLAMVDMRKGKDEAEQFAKDKLERKLIELQVLQRQRFASNSMHSVPFSKASSME
ncbi:Autophagy protein 22, partial [Actinomortierella ambigua]